MNIRKYMVLVISGAVTAVLAGVLIFFLVRSASQYGNVSAELDSGTRALKQLGDRVPFPNEENVAQAAKNLENLEVFFGGTITSFLKNQFNPAPMEPARFPQALNVSIRAMNQSAASNSVAVPQPFFYGFERYSRGQPPVKSDIPRLSRQLHAIETILRAICSAQIRELASIERHVFEDEAPAGDPASGGVVRREDVAAGTAAASGPAVGYFQDPAGLFVKERLILTFSAKESTVWDILNILPKLPVFSVVSDIDIWNEMSRPVQMNPADGTPRAADSTGMAGAAPGASEFVADIPTSLRSAVVPATSPTAGTPATPGRPLKHEERVTAGMGEALKVRMQIDFYTFHKPGAGAVQQEKQP